MDFPFELSFGTRLHFENLTLFRLWAPAARAVVPPCSDGCEAGCGAGSKYRVRIGDLRFPDPTSGRHPIWGAPAAGQLPAGTPVEWIEPP